MPNARCSPSVSESFNMRFLESFYTHNHYQRHTLWARTLVDGRTKRVSLGCEISTSSSTCNTKQPASVSLCFSLTRARDSIALSITDRSIWYRSIDRRTRQRGSAALVEVRHQKRAVQQGLDDGGRRSIVGRSLQDVRDPLLLYRDAVLVEKRSAIGGRHFDWRDTERANERDVEM
mgnify:CR=1 FL=1